MIDHYDWSGGREAVLHFGPAYHGPVVVATMPLLEEWNRTRAFTVTLLRALAERGIASVLPDLPGHGESTLLVGDLTIPLMAEAMAAAAEAVQGVTAQPTIGLSIRSGALLDGASDHVARWHLAPMSGAELFGELHRTWRSGADVRAGKVERMLSDTPALVAGTPLSRGFLESLTDAEPSDSMRIVQRVVRLVTDPRPADRHIGGVPLWRRAEPSNDLSLARGLADDFAAWFATCVA